MVSTMTKKKKKGGGKKKYIGYCPTIWHTDAMIAHIQRFWLTYDRSRA